MTVPISPDVSMPGSVRSFFADMMKAVGLYVVFVHAGTLLTLVISSLVGFLPYSDRPGPGWYGPQISLEQTRFFAGWGLLLSPYLLGFALILFLFVRFLRWAHTPRWLVACVGALASAIASLVIVAGLGWYIALAGFVPLVSGIAGLLYGAFVLPRYLGPPHVGSIRWFHWVGLAVILAAGLFLFVYPGLADRDNQEMSVTFHQVLPGEGKIEWSKAGFTLTPEETAVLDGLNLKGTLRGGLQYVQSGSSPKARILVIVVGDLGSQIRIPQPKHANALFVIRGESWIVYPQDVPMIRRHVTLRQGAGIDDAVARIDGNAGALSRDYIFTWYPPRHKVK